MTAPDVIAGAAYSAAWLDYFARHAIRVEVAAAAGVTERRDGLYFPWPGEDGRASWRRRSLTGRRPWQQETDSEHGVWWPFGAPLPGVPGTVLVTEGAPDALAAWSVATAPTAGESAAVVETAGVLADNLLAVAAVASASMPPERLVAACTAAGVANVVLARDGDDAGRKATIRFTDALRRAGIRAAVLPMPDGDDLADVLARAKDPAWLLADALLNAVDADVAGDETPPAAAETPGSSWAPVGLAAILDAISRGEKVGPAAELMPRTDGPCLLYRGELHSIAAEPESGKTWIVLAESVRLIAAGERVLYIDFEDTPANVVGRLLALGAEPAAIVDRFVLVRPDEALAAGAMDRLLAAGPFALAVIDGVTEALDLLGLTTDNVDIPKFRARLGRPLARSGAATVEIDHVTKDAASRGRYAIGGQHKLAGVAVAYSVTATVQPSRSRAGLLKLTVEKDRHGRIREHEDASRTIALAHIEPAGDGHGVTVRLAAPDAGEPGAFRPTILMERISEHVERHEGVTANQIGEAVKGQTDARRSALKLLVEEGYVELRVDGQAHRHHHLRAFRKGAQTPTGPPVPNRSPTGPGIGTGPRSHRSPPLQGPGGPGAVQQDSATGPLVPEHAMGARASSAETDEPQNYAIAGAAPRVQRGDVAGDEPPPPDEPAGGDDDLPAILLIDVLGGSEEAVVQKIAAAFDATEVSEADLDAPRVPR